VFCIKHRPDGNVEKYQARVVAQGFTQVEGLDFNKTFAPVAKFSSFCTILALAAKHNLEFHQMDIKAAYLNGVLEEEIYMELPSGLKVSEGMVFCLIKAVYSTKQGGQVWYLNIKKTLKEMGYQCTHADHAIFTCHRDGILSIMVIYMDDFSIALNSLESIEKDKEELKKQYQMTDLGEINWILGVHITHNHKAGTITLSQERYIEDILQCFNKSDLCPISTPALANEHLTKLPFPKINTTLYQCTLGALMYPMLGTRPDIAYAIAALGHHAASPGPKHQHALDCLFRYLKATKDHVLTFRWGITGGTTLQGFADTDWASDINDWKSTSGYVFILTGGAISWSSKKQGSIALSSTEAEYIAATHTAKEAIWLRQLLTELLHPLDSPTTLFVDNQSTIAIAKNPKFHDQTKHIDVCYHFLQQKVDNSKITLSYIPTNAQPANALTKRLCREKHNKFMLEMGICHVH